MGSAIGSLLQTPQLAYALRAMRARLPLLPLLLSLLLGGCDIDGRSLRYPGASQFESPSGDFSFYYLAPPWRIDETPAGALTQLSIPSVEGGTGTIPASHQLKVLYVNGVSLRQAAEAERMTQQKSGRILTRDLTTLTSLNGANGWDLQAYQDLPPGRAYYRESFFLSSMARVVRFSILSAYPLDEPDVDDLVLSFAIGGELDGAGLEGQK